MQQQIQDVKTAADALVVRADQIKASSDRLVSVADRLKALVDELSKNALTPDAVAALDAAKAELATVDSVLGGVIQKESDAGSIDDPAN